MRWTEERMDRLYSRAIDILERYANGHAWPILKALSIRGHMPARNSLATLLTDLRSAKAGETARGLTMMRDDIRRGDATALYNLAIHYRNRNDLGRYRHWLARAARHDIYAARELRSFETRFPYAIMRRFRRHRPHAVRDDWQCD